MWLKGSTATPITNIHVDGKDLEVTVLKIFDSIDIPVDPSLVESSHCIHSQISPKKVVIKLNRRQDIWNILIKKKGLKTTKGETLNLLPNTKNYVYKSLNLIDFWVDFFILGH